MLEIRLPWKQTDLVKVALKTIQVSGLSQCCQIIRRRIEISLE